MTQKRSGTVSYSTTIVPNFTLLLKYQGQCCIDECHLYIISLHINKKRNRNHDHGKYLYWQCNDTTKTGINTKTTPPALHQIALFTYRSSKDDPFITFTRENFHTLASSAPHHTGIPIPISCLALWFGTNPLCSKECLTATILCYMVFLGFRDFCPLWLRK